MSPLQKKLLFAAAIFILSLQSFITVYNQREKFFSQGYEDHFAALNQEYNNSQYHKKKNPTIMSDADFEQFAGGLFLKGLNPILIVHDHPPLGRYIVSLSILLFDNPHTIMLPLLLLSVIGFYLLSLTVLKNPFLAFIPVGIFINEPIFIDKLVMTPLPEPIQLPFILFALYFFIRGVGTKKDLPWFVMTSIMLGGVISTRFFVLGAAMTGAMGLYLLLTERLGRKTWRFVATLPLAMVVLYASYFRTMQLGASPLRILSIQKYILAYHQSKFILPFTVWDLLLFNRWHTWWGNRAVLSDPLWTIFWPVSAVFTGVTAFVGLKDRFRDFSDSEKFLLLWVLLHLTMLSTGYTTSRYFLPLLPVLYILGTDGALHFLTRFFPAVSSWKVASKKRGHSAS